MAGRRSQRLSHQGELTDRLGQVQQGRQQGQLEQLPQGKQQGEPKDQQDQLPEGEPKDRLEQLRAKFVGQANQAFVRMFGADGQNGLVKFTEREDRACEVGDELSRWLMAEHIALDPASGAVEVDCPICGGPVKYKSAEQAEREVRELQTRRGKVEYRRAAKRCPRCRKIFFPP
jgi:hypothetical protein